MKKYLMGVGLLAVAGTSVARADEVKLKPLLDVRLRYESVDQAGPAPVVQDAEAVTVRARSGFEATAGKFVFLAEAEATLAISEKYNNGTSITKGMYPIVADPENIELNRIQLQYKGIAKTLVTVGRQRINLDDQRFVGSVGWRQNEQTFDAVRVEWSGIKNLKADVTYSWSDRTIWGIDGGKYAATLVRPQAISGDNFFANLSYKTTLGTLTGFAYLVDEDEPVAALLRNSSQTFGARFAGAYPLSKKVKLSYAASYARQSDYRNNPVNYAADYYLGEVGVEAAGVKLLGGYEVLGGDGTVTTKATGAAFAPGFAFQTPFATLHKFNGWADKFLTTPANGIEDIYGSIGYTVPKLGKMGSLGLTVVYHRFNSDRLSLHYGDEWNAQVSLKLTKRVGLIAKYADYTAKTFGTDTKKFWLELDYAL
ncbi:MAG: alginate export family protein [Sphingobium sp.]